MLPADTLISQGNLNKVTPNNITINMTTIDSPKEQSFTCSTENSNLHLEDDYESTLNCAKDIERRRLYSASLLVPETDCIISDNITISMYII